MPAGAMDRQPPGGPIAQAAIAVAWIAGAAVAVAWIAGAAVAIAWIARGVRPISCSQPGPEDGAFAGDAMAAWRRFLSCVEMLPADQAAPIIREACG